MARPKEFNSDAALDAAIGVFREHGYEGTSAEMLVTAMKIGRQSLYDTFGDKWQLYCVALERYTTSETQRHIRALQSEPKAVDGLRQMLTRVVAQARTPCLGVGSVSEFGQSKPELIRICGSSTETLRDALVAQISRAQSEGDLATDTDPNDAANYLAASVAALRIAARSGSSDQELHGIAQVVLKVLS